VEGVHACMSQEHRSFTFPTAASPSRTSFTLLLGFGAAPVDSAMLVFPSEVNGVECGRGEVASVIRYGFEGLDVLMLSNNGSRDAANKGRVNPRTSVETFVPPSPFPSIAEIRFNGRREATNQPDQPGGARLGIQAGVLFRQYSVLYVRWEDAGQHGRRARRNSQLRYK
jgi:hypothetical protein